MGLPIYTSNGFASQCKGFNRRQDTGPAEFLNLIKNAELVCGNSFHLVVFSIIFKKEFFVLSLKDARMETLLNYLCINNRFCSSINKVDICKSQIDWTSVDMKLLDYKAKGIQYINKSLR